MIAGIGGLAPGFVHEYSAAARRWKEIRPSPHLIETGRQTGKQSADVLQKPAEPRRWMATGMLFRRSPDRPKNQNLFA
jgi:hypothetical protein